MTRSLALEAFGARAIKPKEMEAPPPPPETTELWRMGRDAGFAEGRDAGYAAGAAAAGAEHKAILALATEAVERAMQQQADAEATLRRDVSTVIRASLGAMAPGLLERGYLDDAAAALEAWASDAAAAGGVLFVAPDACDAVKTALSDHPTLATLAVEGDPSMSRFQVRFEWRSGLAEFDPEAAAEQALAIIDKKIAEATGTVDADDQ